MKYLTLSISLSISFMRRCSSSLGSSLSLMFVLTPRKDHFASRTVSLALCISSARPGLCTKNELNNNTAHRTHNTTVSWFIPLQSDSQTLTKLDEKTSKENSRSQYFYDSSSSSLLSTHVLITLFGSPSPNLVVLLNVTKL